MFCFYCDDNGIGYEALPVQVEIWNYFSMRVRRTRHAGQQLVFE